MEELEKVEKIREKTGVSYEEAKDALEQNEWNVLDAIVYLENSGKIKNPQTVFYSTKPGESPEFEKASSSYDKSSERMTVGEMADRFFAWCGKVIRKGCENYFEVRRNGKQILNVPVIVLVILLLAAFWVTVPLLIIGMFFGFKYSFHGEIETVIDINEVCDKAAKTCEDIKNEISGKEEK